MHSTEFFRSQSGLSPPRNPNSTALTDIRNEEDDEEEEGDEVVNEGHDGRDADLGDRVGGLDAQLVVERHGPVVEETLEDPGSVQLDCWGITE